MALDACGSEPGVPHALTAPISASATAAVAQRVFDIVYSLGYRILDAIRHAEAIDTAAAMY